MTRDVKIDFSEFDSLFENMAEVSAKQSVETKSNVTANPIMEESVSITQVNAPLDTNVLQSAQAKVSQIGIELNQLFVERDELVKIMLLAVTTGTNLLMLGPPGTGKSAVVQELCSRIENANYFQWMLNKTSDPSEILGPFSVREMENDRFMRVTSGKLPEAHIAFMDECYKSNAPTLNALLTIMNEHIFYNDGKAVDIPLISLFGASNEAPDDESLLALHDRFIFRINLQYVKDAANKKRMHNNYLDKRAGLLGLAGKTTITLDEINALQQATYNVKVSKDIINKFIRLINDLDKQAIHISDRRANECFKIMQGAAVLRGSDAVGLDDFASLVYALWEKEEHIPIVASAIGKLINPYDDKFKELVNNFEEIKTAINNATDSSQKNIKILESKGAIDKIVGKMSKLINEASKNGKVVDDFIAFREEIVAYNQEVLATALGSSVLGSSSTKKKSPLDLDINDVYLDEDGYFTNTGL